MLFRLAPHRGRRRVARTLEVMAADALCHWLARGRAHQQRRPARGCDPVLSARRARGSALAGAAVSSGRGAVAARVDRRSLAGVARGGAASTTASCAPRLALAEAAMAHGDFATAREASAEAAALAPHDARARATLAGRARRDRRCRRDCANAREVFAARSRPRHTRPRSPVRWRSRSSSRGRDAALTRCAMRSPRMRHRCRRARRRRWPSAARPCPSRSARAASRRTTAKRCAGLRSRCTQREPRIAGQLAAAYCALERDHARAPAVPLLWPVRTRRPGTARRLARAARPGSASWAHRASARCAQPLPAAAARRSSSCAAATRTGRGRRWPTPRQGRAVPRASARPPTRTRPRPSPRAIATCSSMRRDSARRSRRCCSRVPRARLWALDVGVPLHAEPLVERAFASGERARARAARARVRASPASRRPRVPPTSSRTRGTPRCESHQQGDLDEAAAGYADVLAEQPAFAPALHLSGVVAAARNDPAQRGGGLRRGARGRAGIRRGAHRRRRARVGAARSRARAGARAGRARARARTTSRCCACWAASTCAAATAPRAELAFRNAAAARAGRCRCPLRPRRGAAAHGRRARRGARLPARADVRSRHDRRRLQSRRAVPAAGQPAAAIAAYSHVLSRGPAHVAAYKHLGEVLLAGGEHRCVARELPRVREALPERAAARRLRARGLPARRRTSSAWSAISTACAASDFRARDEDELADCLESLLYLLLFFDVEPALLLRFAQAYDAVAPRVYGAPLRCLRERAQAGTARASATCPATCATT